MTVTEIRPASELEPTALGRAASAFAVLPGASMAAALGALAAVRRAKPVHPTGQVGSAELEVRDARPHFEVPLLAEPGTHRCTVRWSRTVGLPESWPDIEGLALRLDDSGADVLLASSGSGRLSRFVVQARHAHRHGPQSTVLPVSSGSGSLLLRAAPLDQADPPTRWELSAAHAGTPWQSFGELRVVWGPDRPLRFDPVARPLPGTTQYRLVRLLREPAYLVARRVVPRPRTP